MSKKIIAAFDFDGTITTKDTLFDFIRFYIGTTKLIKGLIKLSPTLASYKLGIIENSKAKEKLFSYYFKNTQIQEFNKKGESYKQRIENITREEILNKIKWHQGQKHTVVIVSASINNWIKPWALKRGIKHILSTEINTPNNIIDGTFSTKNCYGQEKVNRLLKEFPNREDYILYAYGDSRGDKELLEFADYPTLIR